MYIIEIVAFVNLEIKSNVFIESKSRCCMFLKIMVTVNGMIMNGDHISLMTIEPSTFFCRF